MPVQQDGFGGGRFDLAQPGEQLTLRGSVEASEILELPLVRGSHVEPFVSERPGSEDRPCRRRSVRLLPSRRELHLDAAVRATDDSAPSEPGKEPEHEGTYHRYDHGWESPGPPGFRRLLRRKPGRYRFRGGHLLIRRRFGRRSADLENELAAVLPHQKVRQALPAHCVLKPGRQLNKGAAFRATQNERRTAEACHRVEHTTGDRAARPHYPSRRPWLLRTAP